MQSKPLLAHLIEGGGLEVRQGIELALSDHLAIAKTRGMDNAPCPICGSVNTRTEGPERAPARSWEENDNRFTQPYWCGDCESEWSYVFQVTGVTDVKLADGTLITP